MSTPPITTSTHLFFYGNCIWSNWHCTPRQIIDPIGGYVYESSEQMFMAWKAGFFNDFPAVQRIRYVFDPREAKELGRGVKNYEEKAWECVREGFMAYVLLCKFRQNPEWGEQLKATGGRILIEASPVDKVWGVGMDVQTAADFIARDAMNCCAWPGRNLLGEALMKVRGML